MRSVIEPVGAVLLASFFMSIAYAAPWPPDGQTIAEHGMPPNIPACKSCHGKSFAGDAVKHTLSLRGKSAADLMDGLYREAGDQNDHSEMADIARHLNLAERAAVTAYIASLSLKKR